MIIASIILVIFLSITVFALMKAASDANDHAETMRAAKEEK